MTRPLRRPLIRRLLTVSAITLWTTVILGCGGEPASVEGERAVALRGLSVTQRAWCVGTGPGVVLVSGIGDQATSRQWLQVESLLAGSGRICRYDRPGTGESPPPKRAGRGGDDLIVELGAVVEQAAPTARVLLVAHSFGSYQVLLYAFAHPERIRGVVLVDALDPSVGVARGTGASSTEQVRMADEQLNLTEIETAVNRIQHLPGDPPLMILTRGLQVTPQWAAGQAHLSTLSTHVKRSTATDSSHQIPTEDAQAVATVTLAQLKSSR